MTTNLDELEPKVWWCPERLRQAAFIWVLGCSNTISMVAGFREPREGKKHLHKCQAPARYSLLRVLGRIDGNGALKTVRVALGGKDPAGRDAAVRALADWSDTAAADEHFDLARNA